MCLDWMLVRGISLPAAQLFVIVIENILRCVCVCARARACVCVGNLTSWDTDPKGPATEPKHFELGKMNTIDPSYE